MTDVPVIFSGPMVAALLDGRKTQTRRAAWRGPPSRKKGSLQLAQTPWQRREPGDRLWVKETHYRFGTWARDGLTPTGRTRWRFRPAKAEQKAIFEKNLVPSIGTPQDRGDTTPRWWKRPSIFLPRALSRITLVLTAVRQERLHDISPEDCAAEGAAPGRPFGTIWRQINGEESWNSNPLVVAVTFSVHRHNIDQPQE